MIGLSSRWPCAQLGWHCTELSVPVPVAPSAPHDVHVMSCMELVPSQPYMIVAGCSSTGWSGVKQAPNMYVVAGSASATGDAVRLHAAITAVAVMTAARIMTLLL